MKINHVLFKGLVNKNFRVVFHYEYSTDSKYSPISEKDNGDINMYPSFALSISEGYEKSYAFIPSNRYFQFVLLLRKTVKLVSEHIDELFPDMHKAEFEIDSRTVERFRIEKAMTVAGMTMVPDVWVDESNSCFPAIKIETLYGNCVVPFEDCMSMAQMFRAFDPMSFGLSILRIIGKIN